MYILFRLFLGTIILILSHCTLAHASNTKMYVALHHLQLFILTFIYVGFDGSQSKCNLASAASASLDRFFLWPIRGWPYL